MKVYSFFFLIYRAMNLVPNGQGGVGYNWAKFLCFCWVDQEEFSVKIMSVSDIAAKIVFPNLVEFCYISDLFNHVKGHVIA